MKILICPKYGCRRHQVAYVFMQHIGNMYNLWHKRDLPEILRLVYLRKLLILYLISLGMYKNLLSEEMKKIRQVEAEIWKKFRVKYWSVLHHCHTTVRTTTGTESAPPRFRPLMQWTSMLCYFLQFTTTLATFSYIWHRHTYTALVSKRAHNKRNRRNSETQILKLSKTLVPSSRSHLIARQRFLLSKIWQKV